MLSILKHKWHAAENDEHYFYISYCFDHLSAYILLKPVFHQWLSPVVWKKNTILKVRQGEFSKKKSRVVILKHSPLDWPNPSFALLIDLNIENNLLESLLPPPPPPPRLSQIIFLMTSLKSFNILISNWLTCKAAPLVTKCPGRNVDIRWNSCICIMFIYCICWKDSGQHFQLRGLRLGYIYVEIIPLWGVFLQIIASTSSWLVIWIQIQLYLLTLFRLTKMCPWHSEVGCSLRKEVILGLSTTSSSNCSFSTTFSSHCSFDKNFTQIIRSITKK